MTKIPVTEVDVNDKNITPITQEKIINVNTEEWGRETPINSLYDQLTSLQNRYNIAIQMRKPEMATLIQQGINQLQAIIDARYYKK